MDDNSKKVLEMKVKELLLHYFYLSIINHNYYSKFFCQHVLTFSYNLFLCTVNHLERQPTIIQFLQLIAMQTLVLPATAI